MARPRKTPINESESTSVQYTFREELDLLKPNVEVMVAKKKCDCACKKHRGIPRLVRVYDITVHRDYGWYSMCDDGIHHMLDIGFLALDRNLVSIKRNDIGAV